MQGADFSRFEVMYVPDCNRKTLDKYMDGLPGQGLKWKQNETFVVLLWTLAN